MPVVKTHHDIKSDNAALSPDNIQEHKIQDIVTRVTDNLLRNKPQLIAEVEAGLIDRSVLDVEIIREIDRNGYANIDRDDLINRVMDWWFGYGLLQHLVEDPDVSDIDFPRYDYCIVKRNGIPMVEPISFNDEKALEEYIKHVITRRGGKINESDSHCRISDYQYRLRINGSIKPRNITGASLQIRKHPLKSPDFEELIKRGMMTEELSDFLEKLARSSARILITGKGAAGKTTLLRAIMNSFAALEKVLLCETDTELYPENKSVIVQRVKKANEGGRTVLLLDLIIDGQTMSLDTYVVGEMIGNEAWTVLSTGLNGHRILSSLHANNSLASVDRLLTMVTTSGINLPESTVKRVISGSIDVIIHMQSYKVAEVLELVGFDEENGEILTNLVYRFDVESMEKDGSRLTGRPGGIKSLKGRLAEEFRIRGY